MNVPSIKLRVTDITMYIYIYIYSYMYKCTIIDIEHFLMIPQKLIHH